jgi:phosphoribosylformimino-5-aminoimidazole carboxamide ribotide isomerase
VAQRRRDLVARRTGRCRRPRSRILESETSITCFEFIPAIDLLEGRCVRLTQGRYDAATVYGEDPGALAAEFAAHPLARLHVVDLDGAKAGHPANSVAVRAIVASAGEIPVQLGGGIRNAAAVDEALALGVDRVILGTVALREPQLVREVAARHPGRIVVGIDARDGRVAVEGWLEESDVRVVDVARRFEDVGVAAVVYTDIARDGTLAGPNFEATAELAEAVEIPVILSGGIASEHDVVRAASYAPRGVAGAIVGRAIYTGAVDVGRVLEKLACS